MKVSQYQNEIFGTDFVAIFYIIEVNLRKHPHTAISKRPKELKS